MFGMNAKDAQGLIEDLFILDCQRRSADAQREHQQIMADIQEDIEVAALASSFLRQKNAQINELRDVLTKTQAALQRSIAAHSAEKKARHELAIAASAALATINALVATEDDQSRAQHLYTNHYNAGVDWMMSHGRMKEDEDPRLSGRFTGQNWYIAGV